MNEHHAGEGELVVRIVLIASAVTAIASFLVLVEREQAHQSTPRDGAAVALPADAPAPHQQPIAEEAQVFRLTPAGFAIDPASPRTRPAHPRTLRTYRALRAYPGAPPRIPHGFTADEFRTGACTTCHERGGFSPRFGAYAPVTPHPEMSACLQCHVGNDAVTGVSLPTFDPNARCRQCHAPSGMRGTTPALDWRPGAWPALSVRTPDRAPPLIPHDLTFRGNCLACHAGPSAVTELRTSHPERTSCRQCHVTAEHGAEEFRRPAPARASSGSGA